MSRPEWRTASGLLACLVWTFFVGFPVFIYHTSSHHLGAVDHLHSSFLFAVSEALVFWFFARPRASSKKVFLAEVITDDEILTPFRQDEP
jgi:hypothetical protein